MSTAGASAVGCRSTSGAGVFIGENLVLVRAGPWRMLVPERNVRRVHPAALPAVHPGVPSRSPVVCVEGVLLPVVFAAALAGAVRVELAGHHQMVELGDQERRALLWVDAAEDVVPYRPVEAGAGAPGGGLVAGWSGPDRPLPVLDVGRLLDQL
ncbi:MAG TPA: hypothetical protein VFG59_20910 [Anaeromyxobacter sp.]|nr:hypothetical protein [Anaeromyxobacter sp.]